MDLRNIMRILVLALSLMLVGCSSYESSYEITRDRNKANLAQISLGNDKSRVLEICGIPDKNEQFVKAGANYDVLFYYTDWI